MKIIKGLVPTVEAEAAVQRILKNTKKEAICPVKLAHMPSEDCFDKGYMQTKEFWNDPHNKRMDKLTEKYLVDRDYYRGTDYLANLKVEIKDKASEVRGYIDKMKNLRSLQKSD